MEREETLIRLQQDEESNWARLVFILKRHFDVWALQTIKLKTSNLKLSYMPLIANISLKGSTNIEISKKALIAKQAMSRTINELEEKGMIKSVPVKNDKRSTKLHLTDEGMQFMYDAHVAVVGLTAEYKKLVGEEAFDTAVDVLKKIIKYHEQFNTPVGNDEAT